MNEKIYFPLFQDEDGYPPVDHEALDAIPENADCIYKIIETPFYVKGLSPEDIVEAVRKEDGKLYFKKVVSPSSYSVYRVIVSEDSDVSTYRNQLKGLGCSVKTVLDCLHAVTVPPEVSIGEIFDLLVHARENDLLGFEEASIRHRYPFQETLLFQVREFGWSIQKVLGEAEFPQFAYTIGLFDSYKHPEILIMGLNLETSHSILNVLGEQVKSGRRFMVDVEYTDIVEGYPLKFSNISHSHYEEYMGLGIWYYKQREFPALQCLWPDKQFKFPSDSAFAFPKMQYLLT